MSSSLPSRRLRREFKTMQYMVGIYCEGHHPSRNDAPCAECGTFLDYAARRLEKCPGERSLAVPGRPQDRARLSLEAVHRVAAAAGPRQELLPHEGAVITLLAVTGSTQRV